MIDANYDRRLELNEWLITSRWFYMVAVFLIGIIGNSLISLFEYRFSLFAMGYLLLFYLLINTYFYRLLCQLKKIKSEPKLKFLSLTQILIELAIFTIFMRLVGDNTIASIFFFLPIMSAALIFGIRGGVIVALVSIAIVNGTMAADFFQQFVSYLFNLKEYNPIEQIEMRFQALSFVKMLIISNFYLVIALVAGQSFKSLLKREQYLIESLEKVSEEKEMKERQSKELDDTAKTLIGQDQELKKINVELSKKINELKQSEKSIIRAFTDLQEARTRADEEREKTNAIISNFIDPIIMMGKDRQVSVVNPAAMEIFGFTSEILGQKVDDRDNFSMENFREMIKTDFTVLDHKQIKSSNPNEEELAIGYQNQELTYKVMTVKVKDRQGKYIGAMKIFYNLTREKMIDKLKSDFISIAAHQLRTPLSAIKWVIKMVLDGDAGKLNAEQEMFLSKGYQSNERIISLVNDMLNVSRIEEGRFGYNFAKEDFAPIMRAIVDELINLTKDKKIKMLVNIPSKLPKVYMDKKKMGLVLQNLIENAIKYTPENGTIEFSAEAGNTFLTVKVKDNGVGIPEKDKPKLFSKFFRAENVIRMQTEGSGLGLFIVKNIIEKHGGQIHVNSQEGKGTEFIITIPLGQNINNN